MAEFAQIIFDLDDTLLDTSRLLIPQASRESCAAMIQAGLSCRVEECLQARREFSLLGTRDNVYDHLVAKFGVGSRSSASSTSQLVSEASVSQIGYHAFYSRNVESEINLADEVKSLLTDLQTRYIIHLVTSGNRETQGRKIEILKLSSYFKTIYTVDPSRGERKQFAFENILKSSALPANQLLSVGNRLDTDIADAKRIGLRTCWVRHGEYAMMQPVNQFEVADFEIATIGELKRACRL